TAARAAQTAKYRIENRISPSELSPRSLTTSVTLQHVYARGDNESLLTGVCILLIDNNRLSIRP
ncbi:hypothetical protein, partial [Devosia sp.]|uniref:hypothetical protein n=1 Tax=Devosia sp. TaxID=1871048 RepID=UPI0037C06B0E